MNQRPTQLKAVRGTLRKGRTNHDEPCPAPGRPLAPSWLSGDALAEFNRVAKLLEGLSYLTPADAGVLVAYSLAWAELCAAGRGEKPVTAAMLTSFRQLAGVLGLEPVSRSRIHMPKKDEPETGAWAGFGGGAR